MNIYNHIYNHLSIDTNMYILLFVLLHFRIEINGISSSMSEFDKSFSMFVKIQLNVILSIVQKKMSKLNILVRKTIYIIDCKTVQLSVL